jgi:hypothetical protein
MSTILASERLERQSGRSRNPPEKIYQIVWHTDEAINAAIELLQEHDYIVILPGERARWETPTELCERIGISPTHFCRCQKRAGCPFFQKDTGPKGRIRKLRSNDALESFLRAQRKPGRPWPAKE